MLTLIKNYKNIFLYLLKNQFDAVAKNNDHLTLSQKIVKDSYITKEDLPHLEKLNEIFGKIKEIKEEKKRNEIQKSKENWKNTSVEMLQKGFTVCDEKSFKAFREAMILAWKNDKNNDNIIIPEYNNIIKIISQKNNLNQGKNWKDNLSEKLNWKDKKLPNFSFVLVWDSFYLYTKKIDDNKNQECFQAINFNMDIFWKINKGQIEEIDNTEKSKINERFKKDNVIDNNEIDKEVSKKEINDFIKKVKFSRYKKLWIKIEIPKKPKFCENEDWEIRMIGKNNRNIREFLVNNKSQDFLYWTNKKIEKAYLVIIKDWKFKSRNEIVIDVKQNDFKTNNWIGVDTEINEWDNSDFENQIEKIDIKSELKELKKQWYDNFYDFNLAHKKIIEEYIKKINSSDEVKKLWIEFKYEYIDLEYIVINNKWNSSEILRILYNWAKKGLLLDDIDVNIKKYFSSIENILNKYFKYINEQKKDFSANFEIDTSINIYGLNEYSWLQELEQKKEEIFKYIVNIKNCMEYMPWTYDFNKREKIKREKKRVKNDYNNLLGIIKKVKNEVKSKD